MLMCVKFQLCTSESFRDMRGSQIYTRGVTPLAQQYRKIITGDVQLTLSKRVYNFNFLAVIVSETRGVHNYTIEATA